MLYVYAYCHPYHLEYKYGKVLTQMAHKGEFHVLILFVMALYVHHTHMGHSASKGDMAVEGQKHR